MTVWPFSKLCRSLRVVMSFFVGLKVLLRSGALRSRKHARSRSRNPLSSAKGCPADVAVCKQDLHLSIHGQRQTKLKAWKAAILTEPGRLSVL